MFGVSWFQGKGQWPVVDTGNGPGRWEGQLDGKFGAEKDCVYGEER